MTDEPEVLNEKTGELVPAPTLTSQAVIFGTQQPDGIIERATHVADRLSDIVEKAKLYKMIPTKQGVRKYITCEGWTTMLAMLGIFPSYVYTRKLDRTKDEIAYDARIVLKHLSGHQLGCGEAICSSLERNWAGRDEFAIKSMAQTRALGKAARLSFSWIMALAGYEATPAEEITEETIPFPSSPPPHVDEYDDPAPPSETRPHKDDYFITEKQAKFLFAVWKEAGHSPDDLKIHLKFKYQKESTKQLLNSELQEIVEMLKLEKKNKEK